MTLKSLTTILLFGALIISTGCKKDDDDNNSGTTKTLEQVISLHTWKMEEIRFLQNNNTYYYKRGASGNSLNFDGDQISFKQDKTGIYIGDGITYTLTWDFTDAAKSKMRVVVNYPSPITLNLENFTFSETTLRYTEYYVRNGINTLSAVYRTAL